MDQSRVSSSLITRIVSCIECDTLREKSEGPTKCPIHYELKGKRYALFTEISAL